MRCQDLDAMLDLIRAHNEASGHEIIEAWDPVALTIGYACTECNDDEHTWEIPLTFIRSSPNRGRLSAEGTPSPRAELLTELNRHTRNPFFQGPSWGPDPVADALPLLDPETLSPGFHEESAALERVLAHRPGDPLPNRGDEEPSDDEGIENDDDPVY